MKSAGVGAAGKFGAEAGIVLEGVAQVLDDWAIPSSSRTRSAAGCVGSLCCSSVRFGQVCRSP